MNRGSSPPNTGIAVSWPTCYLATSNQFMTMVVNWHSSYFTKLTLIMNSCASPYWLQFEVIVLFIQIQSILLKCRCNSDTPWCLNYVSIWVIDPVGSILGVLVMGDLRNHALCWGYDAVITCRWFWTSIFARGRRLIYENITKVSQTLIAVNYLNTKYIYISENSFYMTPWPCCGLPDGVFCLFYHSMSVK